MKTSPIWKVSYGFFPLSCIAVYAYKKTKAEKVPRNGLNLRSLTTCMKIEQGVGWGWGECCIHPKIWPVKFYHTIMCPKGGDRMTNVKDTYYRNVPIFFGQTGRGQTVQTHIRLLLWSGSTLFGISSAPFGCITLRKSHLVQLLGWLQQIFGCPKL